MDVSKQKKRNKIEERQVLDEGDELSHAILQRECRTMWWTNRINGWLKIPALRLLWIHTSWPWICWLRCSYMPPPPTSAGVTVEHSTRRDQNQ